VNDKRQAWQRNTRADARDAYLPPKLKVFGPVGALTQSGTGMTVENTRQMMMVVSCGPNTMRSMC
jgi:hypothetical protein